MIEFSASVGRDLKAAIVSYKRAWLVSLLVTIVIGLSIGACSSVLEVVDTILIKGLPFGNPDRIAFVWRQVPPGVNLGYDVLPWSGYDYRFLQTSTRSFERLAAVKSQSYNLTGQESPALLEGAQVSGEFFDVLTLRPEIGRFLGPADDVPGNSHVVVLSDRLWRDQFGTSKNIVGKLITLNGSGYTVVGVAPPRMGFPRANELPGGFSFPRNTQLWIPLALPKGGLDPTGDSDLAVFGRLRSGVTLEECRADLTHSGAVEQQLFPAAKGWFTSRPIALSDQLYSGLRMPVFLLLAVVTVVLVIATSNTSSLLLAHAVSRRGEFALRSALGASRTRLVRQVVTENVLLCVFAGGLGAVIGDGCLIGVRAIGPINAPVLREVHFGWSTAVFVLVLTLVVAALCCAMSLSAIQERSINIYLREGGSRSTAERTSSRAHRILIIGQVALALTLVVTAGLLGKTMNKLIHSNSGFVSAHALAFQIPLSPQDYSKESRIVQFYSNALRNIRNIPGVLAAGITEDVPMDGAPESTMIRIPGRAAGSKSDKPYAAYTVVSPGYLTAAGISLLRGRDFTDSDTDTGSPVVMVNSSMAKRFWPGQDVIGKQVALGSAKSMPMTITGVVRDVKHMSVGEVGSPEMYVPYTQHPWPSMLVMHAVVRTASDPRQIIPFLSRAIHDVDPNVPLAKIVTMNAVVDDSLSQQRFVLVLLVAFSGLALLLVTAGLYAVMLYWVSRRTQELAIRVAVGANRWDIIKLVVGQGAKMAGAGIAIGVVMSVIVVQLIRSMLFETQTLDLAAYGLAVLGMTVLCLAACYAPTRRALNANVSKTLRG